MGNADITAGVDGEVEDACDGSRQKVPSSFSVSVSVVTASVAVVGAGEVSKCHPPKTMVSAQVDLSQKKQGKVRHSRGVSAQLCV